MSMQEKFTAALRKLADGRGLDLVVERTYANTGFLAFQSRESFDPLLRIPFGFQTGYSSFCGGHSAGEERSRGGGDE